MNYKNTKVSSHLFDCFNNFKYSFYFVFVYNAASAGKEESVLMNCVSTHLIVLKICKKLNTVCEVREEGFQHAPHG